LAAQLHEQTFHSALAAGDAAMQLLALQEAIAFYSQAERALIQLIKQSPTVEHLPVASIEHMHLQLARVYQYTHNEENVYSVYRSMNARAKKLHATAMQCLALNHLAAHSLHAWS